jgi:hypothetical protein
MKTPEFVNSIIPKESTLDFVVCKLNIKVVDLIQFLKTKEEFASDNNGFITIDVLRSKNDRSKVYSKFSDWKPQKQVTSAQHQPDRELDNDDLPF